VDDAEGESVVAHPTLYRFAGDILRGVFMFRSVLGFMNEVVLPAAQNGVHETLEAVISYLQHDPGTGKGAKFSLLHEQHPLYFVISGGSPIETVGNIVGDGRIGQTLALSQPGASIVDWDDPNVLSLNVKTSLALAAGKHIPYLIQRKNGSSELIDAIYTNFRAQDGYHSHKAQAAELNPEFVEYLEKRRALYDTVKDKGLDWYKSRGIVLGGDQNVNFKLAMAAEQLRRDERLLNNEVDDSRLNLGLLSTLQNPQDGRVYYMKRAEGGEVRFIEIPSTEKQIKLHAASFIGEFKDDAILFAQALMAGAEKFRKKHKSFLNKVAKVALVACSDSRSGAKWILGKTVAKMSTMFRNPGSVMLNETGELTAESKLFLFLSEWKKRPVIISGHSTCGAFEAMHKALSSEESKAGIWGELADNHKDVYKFTAGELLEDKRLKNSVDGIGCLSSDDVMALSSMKRNLVAVREFVRSHFKNKMHPVLGVFQHIRTCKAYVYSGLEGAPSEVSAPSEPVRAMLHDCKVGKYNCASCQPN